MIVSYSADAGIFCASIDLNGSNSVTNVCDAWPSYIVV